MHWIMRGAVLLACAAGAAGAVACKGANAPSKPEFTGPVQPGRSTAEQRESVSITVYNQNFGLVREIRNVEMPTGRVSLEFRDVAAFIQPETVHVKSLVGNDTLAVYEQNYRYDLLSPQKLLEKYVGKKVTLHRWNEKLGKDEDFEAEVLSVEGGAVFRIGDQITYGFPGRISFPEVPANLISKPTLLWLLGTTEKKQKLEVTYLTQGIGWRADYVMNVDEHDQSADLTGWVTLNNTSGTAYENATLKLVAGDVQKLLPAQTEAMDGDRAEDKESPAKKPEFNEEGFFEYHLYTLARPTTLLDNEQKQVSLLEANGVKVDKHLIFFGANYYYRGSYGMVSSNQKVGVYLDIENKEANHLGMPLPKGVIRVYKADKSGAKQFIGEDQIDHTPRDEKLRIKMGDAFDVVGDRKQTDWKPLGDCTSESAWEISLRNHKDTAEHVEVYEPVGGDWSILNSSLPYVKKDQETFTFDVKLAPKSEVKVTYRVRTRWC